MNYRKVSNIRRSKSQNLKDSRLVLQLSLPNRLKPGVKVENEDVVGTAPTGDIWVIDGTLQSILWLLVPGDTWKSQCVHADWLSEKRFTLIIITSYWARYLKFPALRCSLNRLFRRNSEKKIKALRHWPFCGEFTAELPAQTVSTAENVSICWRHHVIKMPLWLICNNTNIASPWDKRLLHILLYISDWHVFITMTS